MKNLLALVGLAVVVVAGAGYYLNWYKVGAEPSTPGHPRINVEINADKIKKDVINGEKKIIESLPAQNGQGSSSPVSSVSNLPLPSLPALPAPPIPQRSVEGLPTSGLPSVVLPLLPPPPVPNGNN